MNLELNDPTSQIITNCKLLQHKCGKPDFTHNNDLGNWI